MTKVTKLLGGGWLAAVLGIVLIAAFSGLFNYDSGAEAATSNFDRASAHVIGADLAPASLANNANPIRYLPSDINATTSGAFAAGITSNPLIALPVSLTRAVDALAGGPSPYYGPQTPVSVSAATDAKGMIDYDTMFAPNNPSYIKEALGRYYTMMGIINVSRAPATGLGKNVDFLFDSGAGHSNNYTLDSRWSLVTWAGAGLGELVKGTDVSGKNLGASTNAIVTAIFGYDAQVKQYTQVFPSSVPSMDGAVANDKMTLPSTQAFWIATTNDPTARGLNMADIRWVDNTDYYARVIERARGNNVQYLDPFIPAVVAGGGLALDNSTQYSKALGTTAGTDTITATADYPKALTAVVNAIESWKNYQLLTMNSINDGIAQLLGVSSNSYITMRASDAVLGLSESNGTDVTLGTTHEAWYQAIATTALSNSPFLVLALVALFAATCVAMWNPDGMTRNHRAARAPGAG